MYFPWFSLIFLSETHIFLLVNRLFLSFFPVLVIFFYFLTFFNFPVSYHVFNSQELFLSLWMFHFITFCTCFISALSYFSTDVNDSFYVFFPWIVCSKILSSVWFWFLSLVLEASIGCPMIIHCLLMVKSRTLHDSMWVIRSLLWGDLAAPLRWEPAHHHCI